jgi:hypothetical protein
MFFAPLIHDWGVAEMASALGLPTKNVRRWVDLDSIPADWFAAIARAARKSGRRHITAAHLAELAERRRLARASADGERSAA